ncbi:hypothetical protein GCM10025784_13620 [Citricoccus nitrophenolicus]
MARMYGDFKAWPCGCDITRDKRTVRQHENRQWRRDWEDELLHDDSEMTQ